jgi:redox-sensitive bicupin YhaK (pirin superfamily)
MGLLTPGTERPLHPPPTFSPASRGSILRQRQDVGDATLTYEQQKFDDAELRNRFRVVASPDAADGSLTIQQDASIFLSRLDEGKEIAYELRSARHAWLQVLRGEVELNGSRLSTGDGASLSEEPRLEVKATADSELMLFDMA